MTASGRVSTITRSRNSASSIAPTYDAIWFPDTSCHAAIRSSSARIGVSESVPWFLCQVRREKLSTTETSWPRAEKRIAVGQPRYPSPPRMRTRMRGGSVAARAAHRRARIRRSRHLFWRRLDRPVDRLVVPGRADRASRRRARSRGAPVRLRDLEAAFPLEWRGALGDLRGYRAGDHLRHRAAQRAALNVRLPAGE